MRKYCLTVSLAMLAAQGVQGQGMVGADFQVNSVTAGEQYSATVAGIGSGFVVVWSGTSDGSYGGITGRLLAADGTPVGADFQVNTVTSLSQFSAAAAGGPDGGFMVAWASGSLSAGGESEIAARAYDPAGDPLGPDDVQVNDFTVGRQSSPSVASAPDGTFVVAWKSPVYGYPDYEIRARRLAADGTPMAGELQVNDVTAGRQLYPNVAPAGDGEFVVVWHTDPTGSYDFEIAARRLTGEGIPIGTDFQINDYSTGTQAFPVVSPTPGGDFLVVWESFGSPDDDQVLSSVQARLFDAGGVPLSGQAQVNTYTPSQQFRADVATTADGRFVVTWIDGSIAGSQDGSAYGIFARMVGSDGTPAGDEFQVNAYTTQTQRIPAVAGCGNQFVAVWQGSGPAAGRNIWGRRLSPDLVFTDGFEAGDLAGWPSAVP